MYSAGFIAVCESSAPQSAWTQCGWDLQEREDCNEEISRYSRGNQSDVARTLFIKHFKKD